MCRAPLAIAPAPAAEDRKAFVRASSAARRPTAVYPAASRAPLKRAATTTNQNLVQKEHLKWLHYCIFCYTPPAKRSRRARTCWVGTAGVCPRSHLRFAVEAAHVSLAFSNRGRALLSGKCYSTLPNASRE